MKTPPDEMLKKFGMDPSRVFEKRKREVSKLHETVFDGVGTVIKHTLDYSKAKGYGRASDMYILQGICEPGLYALAIAITYMPDLIKHRNNADIPFDSMLFASMYVTCAADHVVGGPNANDHRNPMSAAHALFEKATGRTFRDCFINSCKCKDCAARRKKHGIKLDLDKDDDWI